ncbi:hypothetical protein [Pseudomonas syringae]|nr:hypothetical protein [Pseudomonas syringae]OKS58572.1 hypothetical protein PsaNZ66_02925 [Pseudomonas syringae pv. actinidiae]OKS79709.1 hypothetical protein PsaNZ65_03000 [Pseudomonas syringae pv. actinidiae]OSO70448.1 hypothetical protein BV367_00580 [Pseudomonas syringae pv. actinidiae]PHX38764.1 hypothetical protein AO263_23405 [Pseudomonas sp. NZIPFR-PS5]
MKLTIAMVLFLGIAIGLLETGQQTGFHWVSQLGFGFLSIATVLLLTDIFVSAIASFKTDESHGA